MAAFDVATSSSSSRRLEVVTGNPPLLLLLLLPLRSLPAARGEFHSASTAPRTGSGPEEEEEEEERKEEEQLSFPFRTAVVPLRCQRPTIPDLSPFRK
jgi:hypothetical protein